MPLTASSVSPRLARSIWPVGDTTYGLSPACITSASPSTRTMACRRAGTRLIYFTLLHTCARLRGVGHVIQCRPEVPPPLVPPRRADLIDAEHLDELVAPGLIRRDDSLRTQVLQHPLVAVVGRTDL